MSEIDPLKDLREQLESGVRLLSYAAVDHNTILRQQGQEH